MDLLIRSNTPTIAEVIEDNPDVVVSLNDYLTMSWLERLGYVLLHDFDLSPQSHQKILKATKLFRVNESGKLVAAVQ